MDDATARRLKWLLVFFLSLSIWFVGDTMVLASFACSRRDVLVLLLTETGTFFLINAALSVGGAVAVLVGLMIHKPLRHLLLALSLAPLPVNIYATRRLGGWPSIPSVALVVQACLLLFTLRYFLAAKPGQGAGAASPRT